MRGNDKAVGQAAARITLGARVGGNDTRWVGAHPRVRGAYTGSLCPPPATAEVRAGGLCELGASVPRYAARFSAMAHRDAGPAPYLRHRRVAGFTWKMVY
ncbi:MAG: hypothetical protein OHK0015_43360 [Chloroflexi bacterium OHK40]